MHLDGCFLSVHGFPGGEEIEVFGNFVPGGLPPEDEALRQPLRRWLAENLPRQFLAGRARTWMGFDPAFSRALGEAGYIGLTFPRCYGGKERSPFARFVVVEELLAAGAPVAAHWIAERQSGPLLLRFGTERQRQYYLPQIVAGTLSFCIGMSEPNSGSDLASVRSHAEREGGGWRLNGSKIWTTHAQHADCMIALVRTSAVDEKARHAGLSQFVVDLRLPGIRVRPIEDLTGDAHFAEVFFDDVLLEEEALVGVEGEGWAQVTAELAFERSGPERIYSSLVLADSWIAHVGAQEAVPEDRLRLVGEMTARLATLRTASLAVTARLAAGGQPVLEASIVKDLGTGFEQSVPRLVADDLASHPEEAADTDLLEALFYLLKIAPSFSLRGGTREILRGIIARGLGLR